MKNIRKRRGRKVIINQPIFKDVNTPDPFIEKFDDEESSIASKSDHVYMDSMGFGMGCCCLQVTFQASNLEEARILYDQLTPICPIAMALSAASPVHRGYLTDRDCRWSVISAAVDDRTKEELGEEPLKNSQFRISKSRYDSIDSYISNQGSKYNDIALTYRKDYYKEMVDAGIDDLIAKHIAHLFIRDPITLYKEKLDQDDENESDHFEVKKLFYKKFFLKSFFLSFRTFNRLTGKQCVSNLLLHNLQSVGVWNFGKPMSTLTNIN